jgi:uncharacterized protein (TIGR02996 family)
MISLAELRARSDDRELLLVYADWLAGQGDPRGELIAVQDAEQRCETVGEFERARARAIELIEAHAQLCPRLPGAFGDRRIAWATWRGGFIRRLELLIDRPAPRPGTGLRGWSELLTHALEHPSLALIDELLIRVDLRGEPLDEAEAALAIVEGGVSRWRLDPGPTPPRLALWTLRRPTASIQDRFHAALPGLPTFWYGPDITQIPPPERSPITALERRAALLRPETERYDLIWFDALGHFRDPFAGVDSCFGVNVRHMAEGLIAPPLAELDKVAQRRVTGFVDGLSSYLDRLATAALRNPLGPRPLSTRPERLELDELPERLGQRWRIDAHVFAPAFARFAGVEWWWIEDRCEDRPWTGVVGLGSDELLAFARVG